MDCYMENQLVSSFDLLNWWYIWLMFIFFSPSTHNISYFTLIEQNFGRVQVLIISLKMYNIDVYVFVCYMRCVHLYSSAVYPSMWSNDTLVYLMQIHIFYFVFIRWTMSNRFVDLYTNIFPLRICMLWLFSFIFDSKTINYVRSKFRMNVNEFRSNK